MPKKSLRALHGITTNYRKRRLFVEKQHYFI